MNIKKVRSKRFLSFSDEWQEIDFTQLGRIVNIKGINEDYGEGYSNGSGKSSCIEMIVYGLFGKMLKNLNHKSANNIYYKKGLEIEVEVDNLLIRRKRNPDSLELFENGKRVDVGGVVSTQEEINSRIKLNYDSFCNVAVFGQHSLSGFIEADAATKRSIAENLLGFDNYERYLEIIKKQKSFFNEVIKEKSRLFELSSEQIKSIKTKIISLKIQKDQWINGRKNQINELNNKINIIKEDIYALSIETIDKETKDKELLRVNSLILNLEKEKSNLSKTLSEINDKYEKLLIEKRNVSNNIGKLEIYKKEYSNILRSKRESIEKIENAEGTKCPTCKGIVRKENILLMNENTKKDYENAKNDYELNENQIQVKKNEYNIINERVEKISTGILKIKNEIKILDDKILILNKEKNNYSNQQDEIRKTLLEKEKSMILERIVSIEEELKNQNPYDKIILSSEEELQKQSEQSESYLTEIKSKEKLIPYYDYWIRGFGDKGIRSILLEERIPILNNRINYWLQTLIDNKINISFNRDLTETIKRIPDDGKNFVYHSLSGGELHRIDLAISQAFAYITMIANNSCPSLVFLDEIGTNFDRPGIIAVYNMICKLAESRQVIVVTHDPELLELLSSYDTIITRLKNGISKIEIVKK